MLETGLAVPIGVDDAGAEVVVDCATHGMILADVDMGFCPPANTGDFLRGLLVAAAAAADPSELQVWVVRPGYTSPEDHARLQIAGAAPKRKRTTGLGETCWDNELRAIEPSEFDRDTLVHALPHVTQVLSGECTRVRDRFISLITAEKDRRDRIFSAAGVCDLSTYNERRRQDPSLPSVPRILVHIDYLQGLVDRAPDDPGHQVLSSIAHSGRALGIHLQIATGDPDLVGHVSYLHDLANYRILLQTEHRPPAQSWVGRGDEDRPWIQEPGKGLLGYGAGSATTAFSFTAPPR
ncbi:hypothetical protein JF729_06810 [Mycobacterium intracellulare]|uniref:hypothetical protein n=1 Tax=Mycobacterium intracellulare TaxID=1767 RepID=UPI001CD92E56|nr:hypothetical protein [Mycobacterium intracellulare]MCA2247506.1 hypothetical protein [Mycobacterium intracellulare]